MIPTLSSLMWLLEMWSWSSVFLRIERTGLIFTSIIVPQCLGNYRDGVESVLPQAGSSPQSFGTMTEL